MLTFTRFTLAEYIRSGRIIIELVAAVLFWGLFLREWQIGLEQFFSLTGIFTLLLALYTTAALLSLGERPQGYVMLTRPLGRNGYLLGLYLVGLIIVVTVFVLISALTIILNRPFDFLWPDFLRGALPLLLNIGLLSSLIVLLSALVLPNVLRLALLAVLAVALYSQAWHLSPAYRFIEPFQSLFSWPIYPAIAGYKLSTSRDWNEGAIYIPLAQLALTVLLISLALIAFKRRDVILRNQ
jgi:ABC-type transport system involved in multi-copper enzyme maturation permease subunit